MTRALGGWALPESDRRELASWHLASDLCQLLPITSFFELHECGGTYDTLHLSIGAGDPMTSDQHVKINRVSGGSVHVSNGGAATNPSEDLCAPIPIGMDYPLYRAKQLAAHYPEHLGHSVGGSPMAGILGFMADLLGYAMARDSRRPWAWQSGVSDGDGWPLQWRPKLFDAIPALADVLDTEPDPAQQPYWFLTQNDQPVLAVDVSDAALLIGHSRNHGLGAAAVRLAQAAVRKSTSKSRPTLPTVINGREYRTLPAARLAYRNVAESLASEVASGPVLPFLPGQRITTYAHWFTAGDDQLIVVMGPHESPASAITLLAYGLAWQSRHVLHLVLPPGFADAVLRVIPWLRTAIHIHLATSTGLECLTPPSRQQVVGATRGLPARATSSHDLGSNRIWIDGLLLAIETLKLDYEPRPSYCAWKFRGRQVLKVWRGKGATLRLVAGTDFTKPTAAKPAAYKIPALSGPMSDEQVATALGRIKTSIADRLAGADSGDLEHQFQAELDLHGLPGVLAVHHHREYPAWRSAGRDGFIDFLAATPNGDLDVVETKVGGDAGVALQALEYFIWAISWADEVRGRPGWPGSPKGQQHRITLLLAPDSKGRSYDKYLFGVLEAFSIDVPWRVLIAGPMGMPSASASEPPTVCALSDSELVAGIKGEPPCSAVRYPDDTVYSDQDLFALTGAEDEDTLAWQLFSEIDGAVHLEDGFGLTVFMGDESEDMGYPFSLETLRELARVMERAEDLREQPGSRSVPGALPPSRLNVCQPNGAASVQPRSMT